MTVRQAEIVDFVHTMLIGLVLLVSLSYVISGLAGCTGAATGGDGGAPAVTVLSAGGAGHAELLVGETRVRVETTHDVLDIGGDPLYCPAVIVDVGPMHIAGVVPGADPACCRYLACLQPPPRAEEGAADPGFRGAGVEGGPVDSAPESGRGGGDSGGGDPDSDPL